MDKVSRSRRFVVLAASATLVTGGALLSYPAFAAPAQQQSAAAAAGNATSLSTTQTPKGGMPSMLPTTYFGCGRPAHGGTPYQPNGTEEWRRGYCDGHFAGAQAGERDGKLCRPKNLPLFPPLGTEYAEGQRSGYLSGYKDFYGWNYKHGHCRFLVMKHPYYPPVK
ncbi:hypothetical protein ACFWCB_10250 [Streptomyces sp. NPDC060048]|uniref:hypothetical protein n=1 Tax=unclassified Streptomyces TaxID=2593676 RepID=UPI003693F82A